MPLSGSPTTRAPATVSEPNKIRVLLADDDASVRQGLRRLLCKQPDITIVAEAANGIVALEMARQLHPDVIIMDISMPLLNGIEATRLITRELSAVRIIVFSIYPAEAMANAAQEAGAAACLSKSNRLDDLIVAIRGDRTTTVWEPQPADLQSIIGRDGDSGGDFS